MKTSLPVTCFFLTLTSAIAQDGGKILGTILRNEMPAAGATISLLRAADSATVKLAAANAGGAFLFENIEAGKYLVSATAVGYQKSWSSGFELSTANPAVQLPAIHLIPVSAELGGVTVSSTKPLIEQKIDHTQFIVGTGGYPAGKYRDIWAASACKQGGYT